MSYVLCLTEFCVFPELRFSFYVSTDLSRIPHIDWRPHNLVGTVDWTLSTDADGVVETGILTVGQGIFFTNTLELGVAHTLHLTGSTRQLEVCEETFVFTPSCGEFPCQPIPTCGPPGNFGWTKRAPFFLQFVPCCSCVVTLCHGCNCSRAGTLLGGVEMCAVNFPHEILSQTTQNSEVFCTSRMNVIYLNDCPHSRDALALETNAIPRTTTYKLVRNQTACKMHGQGVVNE